MPELCARKQLPLAVLLALPMISSGASAAALLEMVVVTAQFRAESLQDTPIAITAYNAQSIESMG
ncbi:MAG: iron complex outermembrane receptor protein, partial [Bacteroidia bacterium]